MDTSNRNLPGYDQGILSKTRRARLIEAILVAFALGCLGYQFYYNSQLAFSAQQKDIPTIDQLNDAMSTINELKTKISYMEIMNENLFLNLDLKDTLSSIREIQDALPSITDLQNNIEYVRDIQTSTMNSGMSQDSDTHFREEKMTDVKLFSQKSIPSKVSHHPRSRSDRSKRLKKKQINRISSEEEKEMEEHIFELQSSRRLQTESCSSFRVDIELDEYPEETGWTLTRQETDEVIANVSYASFSPNNSTSIELDCVEPGEYLFSLTDKFSDGITCQNNFNGKPCYSIYVNGEQGPSELAFFDEVTTLFDSSKTCVFLSELILEAQFDPSDPDVSWSLTNLNTDDSIALNTSPVQRAGSQATLITCLSPGTYKFRANTPLTCGNDCYNITVGENPKYQSQMFTDFDFTFYLSVDGSSRERKCVKSPIIAPANEVTLFSFDVHIQQSLDIIQALSSVEEIHRRGSVSNLATCYILFDDPLQLDPEDPIFPERYALALLMISLDLEPEVELAQDPCTIGMITCDEKGVIRGLNFAGVNREPGGIIPTEVGHFTTLRTLVMEGIGLSGTIPSELGRLTNIEELNLAGNNLSGSIPMFLFFMKNLKFLRLNGNGLEQNIPSELGEVKKLFYLDLSMNELTGPIPTEISELTSLDELHLNNNMLTGSIPQDIDNLQFLRALILANNNISGSLPFSMRRLFRLNNLDLSFNAITGTLPPEFETLGIVGMDQVLLNDNFLTGSIPTLNALDTLYLHNNTFSGEIPSYVWNLSISGLRLDDNDLYGEVSESFCSNLSFFEGYEDVYDLTVDDSSWFLDEPLVTCPCCDDANCHLWDAESIIVGGTVRPACLPSSTYNMTVFERYLLSDLITDTKLGEGVGAGVTKEVSMCISPTGCYEVKIEDENGNNDGIRSWDKTFKLGFSNSSRTLADQDSCDAVNICGTLIDQFHPKRSGLNHLTHLVVPDFSIYDDPSSDAYKAMCWLITKDKLFDDHKICDGTLLQRYIVAKFFFSQQDALEFDDLIGKPTCDWDGISCDSNGNFVEHLELPNRKLEGSLITEIGLLSRLKKIDLSGNAFTGFIDPIIFNHLPELETFHIGSNKFEERVPIELLELPALKHLNLATNLFVGQFPDESAYSNTLETFNIENNLFTGALPSNLIACKNLASLNVARNNFKGTLPPELGSLDNLQVLKVNQNALLGSLPAKIFDASKIEVLAAQGNDLTGTIPNSIGKLENAKIITLNHNALKGPIPKGLENLQHLELLHLHVNALTGIAPEIDYLRDLGEELGAENIYMTDCGTPAYALSTGAVTCNTCTSCCNSDEMCQENKVWTLDIIYVGFIVLFAAPCSLALVMFILYHCFRKYGINDPRDPLEIYDPESTYCLIFSESKIAWLIYFFTLGMQISFFYLFLSASSFTHRSSDWQFTLVCPSTSTECQELNTCSYQGWILFWVLTLSSLSPDLFNSMFQIRKAAFISCFRLFLSGFFYFGVTILAVFASVYYNEALATTDTELIVNAVILLFINDLDEQFMAILQTVMPFWIYQRLEEIEDIMQDKVDPLGTIHTTKHRIERTEIQKRIHEEDLEEENEKN